MARYPDHIREFMKTYAIVDSEVWPVPGGKSYAIKHSALERIAAQKNITFLPPQIVEGSTADKVVTLVIYARMGEQEVWSFGEASPSNNKNAYVWSMAEKRGKDRCILKLLSIHGILYSSEELDNTERDATPAYEPPGEPDPFPDNPTVERKSAYAIKRDRPNDWGNAVSAFRLCKSLEELRKCAESDYIQNMIADWPIGFKDQLRDEYNVCKDALTQVREVAA